MAIASYTANPILGALAAAMATHACERIAKNHTEEDGDAYGVPLCN